jgi:hypothetical protein
VPWPVFADSDPAHMRPIRPDACLGLTA